jgi:hypothetical protein
MKLRLRPVKLDFKFEITVLCFFFIAFIAYQLPSKIEPYITHKNHLSIIQIFSILVIPTFFFFVNLLFYCVCKESFFFRLVTMIIVGFIIAFIKFLQAPGIVDPVYIFIMSASCAVIIGVHKGAYFDEQLNKIKDLNDASMKLIEYIRDGYKYFLGKAFQGWLGFGASLGISMSILFRKGFEDIELKFTAIKMLVGFVFITIAVGIWVVTPMLNGIVSVDESLNSLRSKNGE